MGKLSAPATGEPGPKAEVLEPAIEGGRRDRSWRLERSPGKGEQGQRRQESGVGGNAQMQGREAGAARIEGKE